MLLKSGNRTIAVLHHGKDDFYSCSAYKDNAREFYTEVKVLDWDNPENEFKKYLYNHGGSRILDKLAENSDSVVQILTQVRSAIDYGVKSGMDIDVGGDVFRLDKDGYISSKAFQIWYIATKKRIPVISEKEWKEFVTACLDIALKKDYDPLGPDIVDILIDVIKEGEIHDRKECDVLANEVLAHGSSAYFIYEKDNDHVLLVPLHIASAVRKQQDIGAKKARQYWSPFLMPMDQDSIRVGSMNIKYENRPKQRFWRFSMERLADYDPTLSVVFKKVIDCEKTHTTEAEIHV